jgi:transposase-like protein
LTGLPEAVSSVWPQAIVQTCIVHLLRNSFRYASRRDWPAIARDLKPIYSAPTEAAALDRLAEFAERWEGRYPAIVKLWESAWAEFVPFLNFDAEVRAVIYTTNAVESINARIRKAVKARGHFPTEVAAMKCVYLAVMSLDPTGQGRKRWTMRWLSRHGARCWHCCRSVSPCRSPNPPCASRRNGLSTVSAGQGGCGVHRLGIVLPRHR